GLCLLFALLPALRPAAGDQPRPVVVVKIQESQAAEAGAPGEPPGDPHPRLTYPLGPNNRLRFQMGQGPITRANDGSTNNTMVKIDDRAMEYGNPQGRWDPQQAPLGQGPNGRRRQGVRSTWIHTNIHITQTIELVPSKVTARPGITQPKRE